MKIQFGASGGASERAAIASRLRSTREELFGEDGLGEVARLVGVPERTWLNYENGVTIPGEVLLRYLIAAGIEPKWLLDGVGERYRATTPVISLQA